MPVTISNSFSKNLLIKHFTCDKTNTLNYDKSIVDLTFCLFTPLISSFDGQAIPVIHTAPFNTKVKLQKWPVMQNRTK